MSDKYGKVPAGNMERHPAAKEKQRGHTADNKQVEIFGKVEETEMDTASAFIFNKT